MTWLSQKIDPVVQAAGPSLPAYVDFWHETYNATGNDRSAMPLPDREVLASLKASDTAEAAHFLGVNAPPRWPEKQPALDKAICAGYPLTAFDVASGMLLDLRLERAKSIEKDGLDKLRVLTAQAKVARDVRTHELMKLISSYGANVDFDTPIAIVEDEGLCLTVAMMNEGPTVDAPPRAGLAAGLLHDELLSNRCNIVTLLTDKYAQRSGGQSAPMPGTRFTPSRFGCTAQWLGSSLTLGIAEISDLTCEGGDGRYLCNFDLSLYCRADFGDFGSGSRIGTDDMICGIFTAAPTPGTALFIREGDGWLVEDFVPAR